MAVLAVGRYVLLRDRLPSDVEAFIAWQTHGEWRLFDAPWEGVETNLTPEKEQEMRKSFLEKCANPQPEPRAWLVITTLDNRPIGWVSRYSEEGSPATFMVGIDICEDDCLGKGLGTEALRLWVDYLFANSSVPRIGLDTWSFNPRMARVAEKLGFSAEGAQREELQWQGEWLDALHFGLLRGEWDRLEGV